MSCNRLQCSFGADTALPRDRLMINPVFNDAGGTSDTQQWCQDMAEGLANLWGSREITVKSYDVEGTKPVYPNGEFTVNAGQTPPSTIPRELAICLSFFADKNLPRQRGRLYIPAQMWVTQAQLGERVPLTSVETSAQALVSLFTNLGGVDVDWSVWSPTTKQHHTVTDWWVDDEWDIMRSRGRKGTDRKQHPTGE